MAESANVCLHVCITCRAGQPEGDDADRPGRRLHQDLSHAVRNSDVSDWLELKEISCLASCPRGCAAAVSMPGKWSYLLGHLDETKIADLLTYLRVYRDSKSGVVLPSRRPGSLHDAVLARFPSLVPSPEGAA
jgi:predicted metal-binding protein